MAIEDTMPTSERADSPGLEGAKPREISRLDMSLFPRGDDFHIVTRVPVLFSPIQGSPERLVVAALCFDNSDIHLERANELRRLKGLYGVQSSGAVVVIEIALDDLSDAIKAPDFSFKQYRSPVSGLAFGAGEQVEGRSLQEVGISWMSAMSSLYAQAKPSVGHPPVAKSLKGILAYRPHEFDDWGMIRYPDNSLFAVVRRPLSEQKAAEARRTKTDPFEALGLMLIAAAEGIVAEPDDARQAIIELCAAAAADEMRKSEAELENIDAADWERVAARCRAEAADRIRSRILLLGDTFVSPRATSETV
ncbi:hypothetical protein HFN89_01355 [Rhizobium laguerreae]|nr:hypothetical protein [Rhizobium laguerreae]